MSSATSFAIEYNLPLVNLRDITQTSGNCAATEKQIFSSTNPQNSANYTYTKLCAKKPDYYCYNNPSIPYGSEVAPAWYKSSEWIENPPTIQSANGLAGGGKIRCNYDFEKAIETGDAYIINQLANLGSRASNVKLNDYILSYCSDEVTSNNIKGSRFKARSKAGKYCRNWLQKFDPITQNKLIKKLCENKTWKECACVNRESDPSYESLKSTLGAGFKDACWWSPCRDNINYHADSNIPDCSKVAIGNLTNITDADNICAYNDTTNYINCADYSGPLTSVGVVPSFWASQAQQIAFYGLLFAAICIFMFVFIFTSKYNRRRTRRRR